MGASGSPFTTSFPGREKALHQAERAHGRHTRARVTFSLLLSALAPALYIFRATPLRARLKAFKRSCGPLVMAASDGLAASYWPLSAARVAISSGARVFIFTSIVSMMISSYFILGLARRANDNGATTGIKQTATTPGKERALSTRAEDRLYAARSCLRLSPY